MWHLKSFLHVGGGRKDGYVVTKIYRIHKLPFFLTRGAPLPLLRVRQSSAMNIGHENISGIIIIFFNWSTILQTFLAVVPATINRSRTLCGRGTPSVRTREEKTSPESINNSRLKTKKINVWCLLTSIHVLKHRLHVYFNSTLMSVCIY